MLKSNFYYRMAGMPVLQVKIDVTCQPLLEKIDEWGRLADTNDGRGGNALEPNFSKDSAEENFNLVSTLELIESEANPSSFENVMLIYLRNGIVKTSRHEVHVICITAKLTFEYILRSLKDLGEKRRMTMIENYVKMLIGMFSLCLVFISQMYILLFFLILHPTN